MIQPEEPEQKKSLLDRLPRLGRASQLALLIGVFLILFIPTLVVYMDQGATQARLQQRLEQEQSTLERIPEEPVGRKGELEAELEQALAQTEAARAVFPATDQSCDIIERLHELAEANDIDIIKTEVSILEETEGESQNEDEDGPQYPKLSFAIDVEGQVPKFQNFLLALDGKLPTSEIKDVEFTIPGEEEDGEQEHTGTITIEVSCYEAGE